ncbi:MAG TPA: hydrogenase nickel incorporation protein HypB, partial [Candidatus Ozemobacteraceae bacterium]
SRMLIPVRKAVLAHNDAEAAENARLFESRRVRVVNVMASPGAGKTSLILAVARALPEGLRPLVIEGDVASSIDTEKVAAVGIPVHQINTDGDCHLDAGSVRRAFDALPSVPGPGLLFIENIGNLICPAEFDLGEDIRLVIASVPEGDDKPRKYPAIFALADVVVLNKTDLLGHVEFDRASFEAGIRAVNDRAPIFDVSCRGTVNGIGALVSWLVTEP